MNLFAFFRNKKSPFRIVLIYASISVLWIFFSDALLERFFPDVRIITSIQTFKGLFFVFITAFLLFILIMKDRKKLLQSESKYHTLFTNMNECFALCEIICDETKKPIDFCYVEINPAYEKQIGIAEGKKASDVFPDLYIMLLKKYLGVVITGDSIRFEIFNKYLNKYFEVFAFRVGNERFAILLRDISQRKLAEEILIRDKETFERAVEAKTEQLVKANLELERSRRLADIGELAATVAHELRNPLAAISMAAYNIKRKTNDNAALIQHINSIDKKVIESDQIIKNLVFYSRVKLPNYEHIDLSKILEDCIKTFDEKNYKAILFHIKLDSIKDIFVDADPEQMREVFDNLLSNACDPLSEKNRVINISAKNNNGFIEIIIEDNGPGIEQEILDKIFDPFFTTKTKGTGLGLTVSQQIIHMHHGEIKVKSELAQGTTVIVVLPKNQKSNF